MTNEAQKTLAVMQLIQGQHTETFVELRKDVNSLKETRSIALGGWKTACIAGGVFFGAFKLLAAAWETLVGKH